MSHRTGNPTWFPRLLTHYYIFVYKFRDIFPEIFRLLGQFRKKTLCYHLTHLMNKNFQWKFPHNIHRRLWIIFIYRDCRARTSRFVLIRVNIKSKTNSVATCSFYRDETSCYVISLIQQMKFQVQNEKGKKLFKQDLNENQSARKKSNQAKFWTPQ